MADAWDFAKKLGDKVVEDLPSTSSSALDQVVPNLVVETRSPLLAREVVSHPFRQDEGGASGGGVLADLKPKVSVVDASGKVTQSWAPFGEPGKPRLGLLELKLFGGLAAGVGIAFGFGWLVGRRKRRRK